MIASTHLDSVLIKDAVKALFKHESTRTESAKPNLLGDRAKWVMVQVSSIVFFDKMRQFLTNA